MKKKLLLALMALLPLVGWAQTDVTLTLYDFSIPYGSDEPTTASFGLKTDAYLITGATWDEIDEYLTFSRTDTSTEPGVYSYTLSKAADTGTYSIHLSSNNAKMTITKAPAPGDAVTEAPTLVSATLTYNTEPQALLATPGTPKEGFVLEYSVDGGDWSTVEPEVTNAKSPGYVVSYRTQENSHYLASDPVALAAKKVEKGTPVIDYEGVVNTAWTAFDGENHNLFLKRATATVGGNVIPEGVIKYNYRYKTTGGIYSSWATEKTSPFNSNFKNKKDAGAYQVQIFIEEDDNLKSAAVKPEGTFIKITVAQAAASYSTKAKKKDYLEDDPTFEAVYTGLKGADIEDPSSIAGLVAPTFTRAAGEKVGTYKITVTNAEDVKATNYTFTYDSEKDEFLTINPKALNNDDFIFTLTDVSKQYTGSELTTTVATAQYGATDMNTPTDYTYVCTNNINAGTANVIITGQGNYKGSVTRTFSITAAPIYIKPADASKNYGAKDPDPLTTYTLVDGGGNPVEGAVLNGTVNFTREAGINVSTYVISVTSYEADPKVADNYAPTALNTYTSTFTIKPTGDGLKLKFTEAAKAKATKVYDGTTDITALAFSLNDLEVESGLIAPDTWETVKPTLSAPTFAIAGKDVETADNKVTVTGLASTNYPNVTVEPMTFAITASPIEVTVSAQTITYGAKLDAPVKYDEAGWNWKVTDGTLYGTDNLGLTFETVAALSSYGVSADAYGKVITAAITNKNYDLTVKNGDLTVNAGTTIALNTTDDMQPVISAYDGQEHKSVTIDTEMKIGEWYAMVLPFDIDPLEMVDEFNRYVIFNELNTEMTEAQNIKFTLTMNPIAAGTPFLIKFAPKTGDPVDAVVDWSGITFDDKTIEKDITPVKNDYITFTGTYTSKTMQNTKNGDNTADIKDNVWWLGNSALGKKNTWLKPTNNAHTALPMEAYLIAGGEWGAYAPNFTVEDFDGQVTAIKSLNAEKINNLEVVNEGWYTINGIKLNAKPTQKGIYLFNGKKVAIK